MEISQNFVAFSEYMNFTNPKSYLMEVCGKNLIFLHTSVNKGVWRKKNVALEKFLEQTTVKHCNFWAGKALEALRRDCLNITSAQKWHSDIFQISAEKSFQAWQKGSCTFLYNFWGSNLQKTCGKTSIFIQ